MPRSPVFTFGTARFKATRKIVVGGIALAVALVLLVVISVGRTGSAPAPAAPPTERPLATAPPLEPRSEPRRDLPLRSAVSLPTGTWVVAPRGTKGRGILTIQNGSNLDSAVKLVTASLPRTVFWIVYIRAHEERTVSGLSAGTYLLRFALGRDWEAGTRRFLRDAEFYQAGRQLVFAETEPTEDHRGEYDELHLTLNEVVGGNLPRAEITENVFDEGDSGK